MSIMEKAHRALNATDGGAKAVEMLRSMLNESELEKIITVGLNAVLDQAAGAGW